MNMEQMETNRLSASVSNAPERTEHADQKDYSSRHRTTRAPQEIRHDTQIEHHRCVAGPDPDHAGKEARPVNGNDEPTRDMANRPRERSPRFIYSILVMVCPLEP